MREDRSQLETQAAALGVTLPEAETRPQVFKVWPENWEAVCMFLQLLTQWRMGPRGPIGLDYMAVRWLFSLHRIRNPLALLEDVQLMESAYLDELYGGGT